MGGLHHIIHGVRERCQPGMQACLDRQARRANHECFPPSLKIGDPCPSLFYAFIFCLNTGYVWWKKGKSSISGRAGLWPRSPGPLKSASISLVFRRLSDLDHFLFFYVLWTFGWCSPWKEPPLLEQTYYYRTTGVGFATTRSSPLAAPPEGGTWTCVPPRDKSSKRRNSFLTISFNQSFL